MNPSKPIRLVALDIDGTLLDPREEVTPRVRAAVQNASDAGCLVTLATGRRFVGARDIAIDLGLQLPLVLHGGAVVQDSGSGAVIYQDPMEPETIRRVVETVLAHGQEPIVYESPAHAPALEPRVHVRDDWQPNRPSQEYERLRGPFVRTPLDRLAHTREALSVSIVAEVGGLGGLPVAIRALPGVSSIVAGWMLFECDAIEAFRAGCSKASAVEHLAAAYGIRMDEVMAIGDGLNDCELLGAVGWGVAMGNACQEACARARIQVGTNEHDGVAEAIERWVLL
jgi:hydroxymethylpyrimidine pyrophosphatase-like HAD family hydrolase